jgi:hypothetical protein
LFTDHGQPTGFECQRIGRLAIANRTRTGSTIRRVYLKQPMQIHNCQK